MKKPTQAQIDEWKKRYGEVHQITVDDMVCYVRPIKRIHIDHATVQATDKKGRFQPMKFNEILLRDIWIDGDREIFDNDDYFMAVIDQMDELKEEKVAKLKKL